MDFKERVPDESSFQKLTEDWGPHDAITLYLDRCQVDTPNDVVSAVWSHVGRRRRRIEKVVDFGAGDGRFAMAGRYGCYVGYEIDPARCETAKLPKHAKLLNQCAFLDEIDDADVCIGNPPYVRNQDLPAGWRLRVSEALQSRTGVVISGLANAWLYFFLLALISAKKDGLVAIVIPYEWVSRPSAIALREYILEQGWAVSVYRLRDDTFDRVLTTSSITIVDKRSSKGRWEYFEQNDVGTYVPLVSPSGGKDGVVPYSRRLQASEQPVRAKRGLSPGTQEVLTLTEGERVRLGLKAGRDVVPCVTSLRLLDLSNNVLTEELFKEKFRLAGLKCWLIRTDREPSVRLEAYLNSVPPEKYQTSTCLSRDKWWKFNMPDIPTILVATGFRGTRPKAVVNKVGAHAVGSVSGIYGLTERKSPQLVRALGSLDLSESIVPHSNGLKKVEINQLNTLLKILIKNKVT